VFILLKIIGDVLYVYFEYLYLYLFGVYVAKLIVYMYFYVVKHNIQLFICFKTNSYKLFIISNIKLQFISFYHFKFKYKI